MRKDDVYNRCRVIELEHILRLAFNANNLTEDIRKKMDIVLNNVKLFESSEQLYWSGEIYYPTGKNGNRLSDGLMGREFASEKNSANRVWLYRDGTVAPV